MTETTKRERAVASQTSSAKKVLAIVPKREAWPRKRLYQEFRRTGVHMDKRIFDGCLGALLECGLVQHRADDAFIQTPPPAGVPAKPFKLVEKTPNEEPQEAPVTATADETAMDRIATMAEQLEAYALEMIEIGAMLERERRDLDKKLAKFDRLQELLKDLSA